MSNVELVIRAYTERKGCMAKIDVYRKHLYMDSVEVIFQYIIDTMKETIKGWDYFVNWSKVLGNVANIERPLYLLNSLIGKENIEAEFKDLLCCYPEILQVIPALIACRESDITVLEPDLGAFSYKSFRFNNKTVSESECQEVTEFVKNTGILSLFKDRKLKNVVDYVIGVEVGLDSNGRKNRSRTSMEKLMNFIKPNARNNWRYLKQANSSR